MNHFRQKKRFLAHLEQADKIEVKTVEAAKSEGGIHGGIIGANLSYNGWYGASCGGVHTLFITPHVSKSHYLRGYEVAR